MPPSAASSLTVSPSSNVSSGTWTASSPSALSRPSFDNGRVGSCGAGALARSPTPWSGLAWFRTHAGRGRPARSRGTAP